MIAHESTKCCQPAMWCPWEISGVQMVKYFSTSYEQKKYQEGKMLESGE